MLEITFWIVDEAKLPTSLAEKSDLKKYERLVHEVEQFGTVTDELRIRIEALIHILEAIDKELGNTGFLPVFTFNNSPFNVLGDDSDCPAFGYFSPDQAKDLHESLQQLPVAIVEGIIAKNGTLVEKVLDNFRRAASEASRKAYALAIVHE